MSINNDRHPASRPSLLDAVPTRTKAPEQSNRVLAHLEGREPSFLSSSNTKAIGTGALAAVLIGAGGFWAWQNRGVDAPVSVPASSPTQISHSAPVAVEPDTWQATSPPETAQPARILEAPLDTAAVTHKPAPASRSLSSATLPAPRQAASRPARSSPVKKSAALKASTAAEKSQPKKRQASQAGTTAQASARRADFSKPQPQRAARPDPDAELLATLLQRRDPREAPIQK